MTLALADVEARRAALDWVVGVHLSAEGVVTATCPSCELPDALFLSLPVAADDPLGIHCG